MKKLNLIYKKIGKYAIVLFILAGALSTLKHMNPQVIDQTTPTEANNTVLGDATDQKKLELYAKKLKTERHKKELQDQLKQVEKELEGLRGQELGL